MHYMYFLKFLIRELLLCNAVLVSALQQHESVVSIHLSHPSLLPPPAHPSHSSWSSQSTRQSSLCYIMHFISNLLMLLT